MRLSMNGMAVTVVIAIAALGTWWPFEQAGARSGSVPARPIHATSPTATQHRDSWATGPSAVASTSSIGLDSQAPHLEFEANGWLQRSRRARDLFDYVISTTPQASPELLDRIAEGEIARQAGGRPARQEASDLWRRYRVYLDALALAERATALGNPTQMDLDALQSVLEHRMALRELHLGEWSSPFFGDEQREQMFDLARLRLARSFMSTAEKAIALPTLEQSLTPAQRAERDLRGRQTRDLTTIGEALSKGTSSDEVRARVAASLGPEVAQRATEEHDAEQTWQQRYARYAMDRDLLLAQRLSRQERLARLSELRARHFPSAADAFRAGSLDAPAMPEDSLARWCRQPTCRIHKPCVPCSKSGDARGNATSIPMSSGRFSAQRRSWTVSPSGGWKSLGKPIWTGTKRRPRCEARHLT